jgi:hypothetical protein
MKINTGLFFLYLQEDHENYQSMQAAGHMYSMAANVVHHMEITKLQSSTAVSVL